MKTCFSIYKNNPSFIKSTQYVAKRTKYFFSVSETCETGVRSHHGNGNFACCRFPFVYNGESHHKCLFDDKTGQFWCATTTNYDQDKLFGYC